jgi:SAM-dependent methyltransferase
MKDLLKEFDGMLRVVQFNWPLYATAACVMLVLLVLASCSVFADGMRVIFFVAAAFVLLQTVLSLLASHWVYDRSALKDWRFLLELIPPSLSTADPRSGIGNQSGLECNLRIVSVHSGYDETSGALRQLFARAEIATVDLYPALGRRESSIMRARKLYPPLAKSICETISDWPLSDSSVDFILIAFAAHEVRDSKQRELLFQQARRVLKPSGRIVLVEHVRDFSNFLAFSLGFMHFLPLVEWIRCASKSHLKIAKQYRITPLVAVLELCL